VKGAIKRVDEAIGPVQAYPAPGGGGMRLEAQKASMAALADMLSRIVDLSVVDMTGLKGAASEPRT
jgi:uncharacterized protein (TIGR03435 family)